jgi:hypothetical protein
MDKYERYLRALCIILVEIRSSDNIALCNALADIFHNVPAKIASNRPTTEIKQDIIQKAINYSLSEYLRKIVSFDTLQ